jgi:hypothetical protein
MYHPDPNINVAVERQSDRVRSVRAFRDAHQPEVPLWARSDEERWPWPARRMRMVFVLGTLLGGLALIVVFNAEGVGNWLVTLIR